MIPATGVQPHSTGTNYPAIVTVYGDQTATVTIAGVESEHFPVAYADTVAAFAKAFYVHAQAPNRTAQGYREAMAAGIKAARHMARFTQDGHVALVESGTDCDGVQYFDRVHIVDATWAAVRAEEDRIREWADGPFTLRMETPDNAEQLTESHINPDHG